MKNFEKKNNQKICIIFCTFPDKNSADFISKKLLQKKYAACITQIPNIISYYYWNDNLEKKSEIQILIKTCTYLQKKIIQYITKYHPYTIPELFSIESTDGELKYLNWIKKNVI